MLEEKTYTLAEIAKELGGASDRQSVKRKLERYQIRFSIKGRSAETLFTIEEIGSPFKLFCVQRLGFDGGCDFDKVLNLFYYFFNDEEFQTLPDEGKEARLRADGLPITRQSIAKYLNPFYRLEWFAKDDDDVVYYFASDGNITYTNRQKYLEAWHDYWEMREVGADWAMVCGYLKFQYGGFPRKQAKPKANAIEMGSINELIDLTNQAYEKNRHAIDNG